MKLNNKGWGYRMMVFLMTILCSFLLVAIYFVYKYYETISKSYQTSIPIVRKSDL